MTRPVERKKYHNYLTKAESLIGVAKIALSQSSYDAAVLTAVHSAINALDALTTNQRGLRASGEHDEVLEMIKGLLAPQEYSDIERQFKVLLSLKNPSEYQPVMMSQKEAQISIKAAQRILDKVKANLS